MFDVIQIQLPAALQTRLASTSNRLSGGHILTVFAMGALSALIIGPCVAPPLALALGYIGSTGDAALGAAALYCMASGLGLPLIVVGTFGGHLLPRAGRWMNNIKYLFGTIMLALAVSLATPFIPGSLIMVLWGALAIGCAVFLRALDTLPVNAHALTRLGKALGLLLFLVGATELVGVMAGETNPRYPLRWMHTGPAQAADLRPAFLPVGDAAALDKWLAANPGRPALLDFYADWCVSCKEMDSTTWKDPGMTQALQGFTTMRADVTQGTPAQMALMKRFGLFGPPAIILFDRYGRPSAPLIGYIDADALKNKLMPLQ
jgi:thiol:disulfide interchange protein DsbD